MKSTLTPLVATPKSRFTYCARLLTCAQKQLPLKVKSKTYPGFVEASPKGLVPALDNDGESVWESLQLVEYINEAFAGPRLMPDSAHARAMVRIWIAHCDSKIQKNFYLMLMEQDAEEQAKAKQALLDGCRALARAMAPSGFFLGDTFSEFEIAIAPFWQRYLWVGEHYRGFQFPDNDADFDRLAEWWERTSAHPSVAATQVCKPRLISSYSQYSTNAGTSDYAKSLQRNIRSRAGVVSASGSGAVPFFVGMGLGVAATAVVLNKLR